MLLRFPNQANIIKVIQYTLIIHLPPVIIILHLFCIIFYLFQGIYPAKKSMAHTKALIPALILLSLALVYSSTLSNLDSSPQHLQTQLEAPALCMGFLPYSVWNNPQVDYYNWYGLEGKSLTGKTYLIGHAFERHVAVNNACTLEQKQ